MIVHGKNRGAAEAINTAARAATGKFMTWVSADNEMTPGWLAALLARMTSTVGVAYANYDRFNGDKYVPPASPARTWGKPYDPTRLLNDQNCYIGPAFLVRAEIWREVGDLRGKINCDYDHWLRIEEACLARGMSFSYEPTVLCHYYAGNERITVTRRKEYDAHVWQEEARKRRGLAVAIT
jgi:glycosyltransferase involved in cell wall biosynthesis